MLSEEEYLTKAKSAYENSNWQLAVLLFKKALYFETDTEYVSKKLIKCHLKLNQYLEAEQVLQSNLHSSQHFSNYFSQILYHQGKLKKSLKLSSVKNQAKIISEIQEYSLASNKPFMNWLKSNGAKINFLKPKFFQNSRGLSATTHIPPNSKLIFIPNSLIIYPHTCQSALGLKEIPSFKSYHSIFALFLAVESKKESFWTAFLRVLPKDFSNFPWFWGATELSYLKGSSLLPLIMIQKQEILDDFNLISELNLCSFEEFLIGKAIISSRLHSIRAENNLSGLVPFADLFNHRKGSDVNWFYDYERSGFCVENSDLYERGEEVFIDYGGKSNIKLMIGYGFALRHNEDDEILLFLDFKKKDKIKEMKKLILGKIKYFRVNTKCSSKEFLEVLGFLRLRFCEDPGFLEKNKELFYNLKNIKFFSKAVEIKALRYLKKALGRVFQGLDNEDIRDLGGNAENCFLVKEGEKRVACWVLEFCDYFLEVLEGNRPAEMKGEYSEYSKNFEF